MNQLDAAASLGSQEWGMHYLSPEQTLVAAGTRLLHMVGSFGHAVGLSEVPSDQRTDGT